MELKEKILFQRTKDAKGYVIAIAMVMKKRRDIVYEGERGRLARIYFINCQQVGE